MDLKEVVSAYYSIYEGKKKEDEKPKKWFDDDGDGEGYEEGEVDGKFDKKKKKKKDEEDVDESLEILDDFTEEEIEELVEEAIYESLNEGIEYEELQQVFNTLVEDYESDGEFLSELNYSPKPTKRVGNPDLKSIAYSKKQQAKAELAKKKAKEDKESAKKQAANKRAYQRKEFVKKVSAAGKKVLSKGKEALKKGAESVKSGAESIKSTAKSKVNAVKGDITRRAMDATGTKLKTKTGKPLTSSQYHPQHQSVRKKSREAIKANIKSKVKGAVKGIAKTAGRVVGEFEAGRAEAKAKAKTSAPKASKAREVYQKKTAAAAAQPKRSTTYSMKGAGGGPKKEVHNWTSGANPAGKPEAPKSSTTYRGKGAGRKDKVTEELLKVCEGKTPDAYDLVLAYIIDEGFADTFEQAEKIMIKLSPEMIKEVHEHQLNEAMLLTRADKVGNTPAWQNRDKKNVKTGEPIYKKADHLKKEDK